ncbi:MFS transporter [Saxibacter everestensis]|uniref:MFS transporter n=1 Tax=Saxibacter everestensis TaxID=2909229 RepID=A0ABY8R0G7_9MICO|nr:MFS transporter [Brevibacteriaceae bacterium ZFBP1038]
MEKDRTLMRIKGLAGQATATGTPGTSGGRQSLWDREHRAATIGLSALAFLVAFEALAVTTAMPTAARELNGVTLYGLAFAAPLAVGIISMTFAGSWSDRSGPGRPLQVGILIFVAGLVVVGLAPSMWMLVAGRGVQGLGAGLISVALYVVIGRRYAEALRPRMFTMLAAAWVLPAIVGPALAGLVTERLSWRWVFLAVPLLAVSAGVLLVRTNRALRQRNQAVVISWAQPLWAVVAALGVLVLSLFGERELPWWGAGVLLGVGLVAVAVPRLLPGGIWRAAEGLPAVIAMRGFLAAAFVGAEVFIPLMLSSTRGLSASLAGLVLTTAALSWFAGSWFAGRSVVRPITRLRWGAVLIVVGTLTAALPLIEAVPVAVGMLGWGLAGAGMGMAYPTLSVLTLSLSAPDEQGANSSALQINEAVAQSIMLAISGAVFAWLLEVNTTAAYAMSFLVAAGLGLIGLLCARRIPATVGR